MLQINYYHTRLNICLYREPDRQLDLFPTHIMNPNVSPQKMAQILMFALCCLHWHTFTFNRPLFISCKFFSFFFSFDLLFSFSFTAWFKHSTWKAQMHTPTNSKSPWKFHLSLSIAYKHNAYVFQNVPRKIYECEWKLQVLAAQRNLIYGRDIYVMTYEGETGILASERATRTLDAWISSTLPSMLLLFLLWTKSKAT